MTRKIGFFGAVLWSIVALTALSGASAQKPEELPENLAGYEHINSIVVPDPESPVGGFHHLYMNETGLETFRTGGKDRQYPTGTVIGGKVYQVETTEDGAYQEGDLAAYTLMRKDPDSPDAEDTGGWRFFKLSPKGERIKIEPVADCFQCHKPHAETDYVISDPLK